MASPLSTIEGASLNMSTPPTTIKSNIYQVEAFTTETVSAPAKDTRDESPLAARTLSQKENLSPTKSRHSRVLSGAELSPLKILSDRSPEKRGQTSDINMAPPALLKSPRKMSPEKRFPIKVSNPLMDAPSPTSSPRAISLDDAMQDNEGLKRAIDIFEDEQSTLGIEDSVIHNASMQVDHEDEETAGLDDTMISTFSTFSAVPFAKVGKSPNKFPQTLGATPRARPDSSSSQTPRPSKNQRDSGNTTNLLMDFTDHLRFPAQSAMKRGNLTNNSTVAATPTRGFTNLIDFDIPPMPTPRSLPSITPRELESLKSNFLSEISSLKASLSGKEAEVHSLKSAVGDAEKRVGESLEQLREEQIQKDQLAAEKDGWENRGREMESVLRKVKEEIVHNQNEQEELEQKLDESEKRREAAEMLHQEAESKMAGMRAGRDLDKSTSSPEKAKSPGTNREVEIAVERVARELHGLYKSKHESKVAALKKSYETRWQKKIRELESRIDELNEDNERLRVGRDATMTRVEPNSAEVEERKLQAVKDSAAIKELTADVQRLEAVVGSVQNDNESLRVMLEQERVEKGELVQLAEEMMNMQSFVGASSATPRPQTQATPAPQRYAAPDRGEPAAKTPKTSSEGFKSSAGRASGLRAPGTAVRMPQERPKSGGLPRPGGYARSGIMSSIEKMGSYRGRGVE